MARLVLIGLLALPLIEIAVMIKVGQTIGLWPTLGLLVAGAVMGALLIRLQGIWVLDRMRRSLAQGAMPARAMADAMMIGLAAMLLILPGFLSDIVALGLLVGPVRGMIYGWLASRFVVVETADPYGPRAPGPPTIELGKDGYHRD